MLAWNAAYLAGMLKGIRIEYSLYACRFINPQSKGTTMFNKNIDMIAFNATLAVTLEALGNAEKITKETLRSLSREMLDAVHIGGDIQPVNRLLDVLTPMNRKTCVLFFQHFSGHFYSEKDQKFGKRDKAGYAAKYVLAEEFLDDPLNNVWSWAERNIEMEAKPFTLLKVSKQVESLLKKADKAGFSQADTFKAMVAGGLDVELIEGILEGMAGQE